MSTVLNSTIIASAKESVSSYVSAIRSLNQELEGVITSLTSSGFIGDASQGYGEFYKKYVVPAVDDNLVADGTSITASISSMLDTIEQQLINTVDPKLGDYNRNPNS